MSSDINADSVLAALTRHIGRANGIQIETLVWEATNRMPNAARQRRARQVVSELRAQGHHICAHPSDGYYIAANAQELEDTCQFLLDRAMKSLVQVSAMKRKSMPELIGQMNLLKGV